MKFTEKDILSALSTVNDPDLHKDLVTLNMIRDITVSEQKVSFTVMLTTPACPLKEKIRQDCVNAVKKVVGEVELEITMSSSVTSARDNAPVLTNVKNIIAIASG
ncbi:MAG TPA: iron-sulfur cluster assembly protein, partial [Cyclobacteriaceae bacterium]|nr:iron-sulfur cluster assembly protein [Cyclobacteriaceae bacterium]